MSLIKCPECGAEISSNAEQCMNCGCKITCCPECNKVFIGESEVCDNCGYVFKKTVKNEVPQFEKQVKQISNIIDIDKKLEKRISIIKRIIEIISGIMLIIGCVIYYLWDKDNSLEKLLKLKSLYNSLVAITIVGCTCLLVSMELDDLSVSFLTLRRATRFQKLKFDRKTFAENGSYFAASGSDADIYATSIKQTIFINENPQIKKWFMIPEITHILFDVITDVCLSVWVIGNLKALFAAKLIEKSYSIEFVSASFFCAIIFFVVGFVCDVFLLENVRDKAFKKWCKENSFN